MKRVLAVVLTACAILFAIVVVRTALFTSQQIPSASLVPLEVDREQVANRLSRALKIPTISSRDDADSARDAFDELHAHLAAAFPLVHAHVVSERINRSSVLYTWRGTKDSKSAPILLAAHLDVVPADSAGWRYPPFAGTVAEGFIWGRGAIDDKASALGILEAVESLIVSGFTPMRTIYIAFGHDEEVGGADGAAAIAALLESQNTRLEFVLDEGGAVTQGIFPLASPVATVGIAEKGYLTLELRTQTQGGHAMSPPSRTAIGTLARAVAKLEANPFPDAITGATRELIEHLGPEMPLAGRIASANLWLFAPVVERRFKHKPSTNAAIRTTIAATMFESGIRENVLPANAKATINFRILPGDSVQDVIDRVQDIAGKEAVSVDVVGKAFEPSSISRTDSPAYAHLAKTIRSIYPEAVVAPYLVLGATDARHYAAIANDIYRFLPLRMTSEDLTRFHGVNERISLEDYVKLIQFYGHFLRSLD
jgi:carboxypeptidase PM20D1